MNKYINNLKIRTKLQIGFTIILIIAVTVGTFIIFHLIKRSIETNIEHELNNSTSGILNMVETVARTSIKVHLSAIAEQNKKIVQHYYDLFKGGKLSEAKAKEYAGKELLKKKIGKTGYIFVWDIKNAPQSIPLVVHPLIQGRDVSYVDFVQIGAKKKYGYLEYEWANPGEKRKRKKSMYLTYFPQWDWVIAASSYKKEFLDLVSIEDIKANVIPLHFGKSGYSFIIDTKGNVIVHPKVSGNYYYAKDADGKYFIKEICKNKKGKIVYRWKDPDEKIARKKLVVYNYLPQFDWIIASSSYHDEFYKPLNQLLSIIVVICIIALILVLSLSFVISSSITKPIDSLIERFSQGSKGDFTVRMNINSNDEFGKLSKYFNIFMEQLEKYSNELNSEIMERKETAEELTAANRELCSMHDQLIKSNENLSAEKERLMITLRSIGDGVLTTDKKGNVILINNAAERIIEEEQENVFSNNIDEVISLFDINKKEPIENPVWRVIKTGEVIELEHDAILVTESGKQKDISATAAPIRDSIGNTIGIVLVIRDITERKKIERELHRTSKIESLGVFAGGIAHDFNNILTALIGNISLAREIIGPENSSYELLKDAENASLHAKNLTQQLLTFSKGSKPIRRSVSMVKLLRESSDFILSGSGIRCEYNISDDLWNAHIDAGQFTQVIYNIIINARQAMPRGGIIRISAENYYLNENTGNNMQLNEGMYIKVSFRDQGKGIPQSQLKKIFDPYYTTKNDGNGLGLSICYSIIKKHNGYITVESEPGKGANFIILVPASFEKGSFTDKKIFMKSDIKGKILIMDDDDSVLKIASKMLLRLGFNVDCAKNGEEAIMLIKEAMGKNDPFTTIIMDLTVPGGMGGKEAIKYIKEIAPDIKTIVSSGYSNDPVMANYLDYGFNGIIAKPYRFEEMGKLLYKIISSG